MAHLRLDARAVVNPARAGMIRMGVPHGLMVVGKPRASGDDPVIGRLSGVIWT